MRAADKKYFDKYAIDPFQEESIFDSCVEGWVDDFGGEEAEPGEFYLDDWDELL